MTKLKINNIANKGSQLRDLLVESNPNVEFYTKDNEGMAQVGSTKMTVRDFFKRAKSNEPADQDIKNLVGGLAADLEKQGIGKEQVVKIIMDYLAKNKNEVPDVDLITKGGKPEVRVDYGEVKDILKTKKEDEMFQDLKKMAESAHSIRLKLQEGFIMPSDINNFEQRFSQLIRSAEEGGVITIDDVVRLDPEFIDDTLLDELESDQYQAELSQDNPTDYFVRTLIDWYQGRWQTLKAMNESKKYPLPQKKLTENKQYFENKIAQATALAITAYFKIGQTVDAESIIDALLKAEEKFEWELSVDAFAFLNEQLKKNNLEFLSKVPTITREGLTTYKITGSYEDEYDTDLNGVPLAEDPEEAKKAILNSLLTITGKKDPIDGALNEEDDSDPSKSDIDIDLDLKDLGDKVDDEDLKEAIALTESKINSLVDFLSSAKGPKTYSNYLKWSAAEAK